MLSFALRVLVREGVKTKPLFRSSCFPERRKERLARKPSISNQSNLPVIICDQHQITPARHDPSSLRCNGPLYGCVYTGGGRGEKRRERKRERESVCVDGGGGRRGGGRISHRNGNRRLSGLSASGAARASGAESCWAGAERGAWHTAPPPPPTDISLPSPPPRSSWASLTGVKLIINRVKLIKGLGARWGCSESPSPSPSRPLRIRLPADKRPGSGDWPPPPSRGSSGAAQPEQEGKGWRGGGRKTAAAAANPAGWLTATEIVRASSSGGGRRGLAPGWLGSAQLGVYVPACVQSRVPGAARGRCSAPQGQPPPSPPAPPLFPYRDQSLPRREWGTAGDAAGPAHASASSPAEVGKG